MRASARTAGAIILLYDPMHTHTPGTLNQNAHTHTHETRIHVAEKLSGFRIAQHRVATSTQSAHDHAQYAH